MTEHNLFYYPYSSFTNQQLPLLKVAALYFDKLVILDPVGASWATVDAEHVARDAITLLKDAGILEVVTPADVLAKYAGPLTEAVRRDMADREFLELCDAHGCAGQAAHPSAGQRLMRKIEGFDRSRTRPIEQGPIAAVADSDDEVEDIVEVVEEPSGVGLDRDSEAEDDDRESEEDLSATQEENTNLEQQHRHTS